MIRDMTNTSVIFLFIFIFLYNLVLMGYDFDFILHIFFIESFNYLGNRTSFCLIQDNTLVLIDDGKMPGDFKTIQLIPLALYL